MLFFTVFVSAFINFLQEIYDEAETSDEEVWSVMKAPAIFLSEKNARAMKPMCASHCRPIATESDDMYSDISDEECYKNVSFI